MKPAPGTIVIALLGAGAAVSLWQLWDNSRELNRLREQTALLREEQKPRPPSSTAPRHPPASLPAGSPAEIPAEEQAVIADLAKLSPEDRASFLKNWEEQMEKKRAAEAAAKALAERNKGREAVSYAGGKATGPPDAEEHGGNSTSTWCAAPRSSKNEWLKLSYGKPVEISEIAIHETYATGALSRVVAIMPDGKERVIWEGTEPVESPPVQRIVQVPPGVRSDQIRIELDTTRTNNWQEIDAVQLIGRDGSRQWAKQAEGSSYYGSSNHFDFGLNSR